MVDLNILEADDIDGVQIKTFADQAAYNTATGTELPATSANRIMTLIGGIPVLIDDGGALTTLVTLTAAQTLTNKTLTTPTIASFASATHNHSNAAGGGTLAASAIASGQIAIANGGTGQATQTAAMDALSPNTTKGDVIVHNGTNNIRLAVGTDGQVLKAASGQASGLQWAAESGGGGGLFASIAILRDEKATTVNGGGSSATTWNARDLNTEVSDVDGIVSISSNQFTPVSGTYLMVAAAPARQVAENRLRLYNVTGAATVDEGMTVRQDGTSGSANPALLTTIFTANGTDAYRIGHYTAGAVASVGLGDAANDGSNEVYLEITLYKFA